MSEIAVAGFRERSFAPVAVHTDASQSELTAEVVQGADAYSVLAADFNRIAARQAGTHLFQLPSVLAVWARHFATRPSSSATIVVRDRNRPVLIWPIFIERRLPLVIACNAGSPIAQYDEVLIEPDTDARAAFATALSALRTAVKADVVVLERVRADGALQRALPEGLPVCSRDVAPFVDLSEGLEAAFSKRKSSVAKTQRKRVKRFAKEGSVAVALAATPDEAEAWLGEALALKREWLRSTGRVSRAFMKAETGDCLAEFAQTLSSPGSSPQMIAAKLTLDGRTTAIEAGFRHRSSFHIYLRAFAPEFAHFGPGNILTQHMIEWCAENGIERYDMLAPGSRNKSEWQTGEVEVSDIILPMSARGRLYAATVPSRIAPALRSAFYALPERLRATIAGKALRL
jgi:CelD/BcsL family acetyltransferase involved in cellulose biosynthesis